MASTFSVDVLREPSQLEALRSEWMALLAASASNVPTLSPTWILGWWNIFGREGGRKLAVLALREGGKLIGLAPLLTRTFWHRPAIPFHRFELIASGEDEADEICSEYIGVIVARGYEERVAHTLASLLCGGGIAPCDEIVLPAMRGDSFLPQTLAGALSDMGFDVTLEATMTSPYIPLPSSWEAYLGRLSSSHRYLINRSLRDFDKWAGKEAVWRRVESLAELGQGKSILHALHEERWSADGKEGVFASSRFEQFHDAIMPVLLEQGALELSWLEVRGEPIAAIYNIFWDGKIYFYQSGRKTDLPKGIRPGIVMHGHAIQRAIAAGHKEYDFLAGASQYKKQLALAYRPLVTLRAARRSFREVGRRHAESAIRMAAELRRKVVARLVASPPSDAAANANAAASSESEQAPSSGRAPKSSE